MKILLPALAGILPFVVALCYGAWRTGLLRRRCLQLQNELEVHRESGRRLDFIAHHDSLTGLPNRLQLRLHLEHGLAYARRHNSLLAVLFVDIDHFKKVNDTLGHDAGDQVLVQFSQRLRQCVRQVDTVARQGGDEFIVLLTELRSARDAQQVADKIIAAIAAPFIVDGVPLPLGASVGVAIYPDDDQSPDDLVDKADLALYAAKQRGGGASVRFAPGMQVKAYTRLMLETALRQALEQQEFILNYQPRLDLTTRRITGVKALLRWKHPELGLLMPFDFLPVLEGSALVLPVGAWVLAAATAQARLWLDAGHPLTVSVHLSPRQFYQQDIVASCAALLEQAGLPGRYLELEVAENMLVDRKSQCEDTLRGFKQLGVRISISDFGTGHASLNYLRRFAVDLVKIDKCFVDELGEASARDPDGDGGDGGVTARAIIAMAHTLNVRVVAGGVESADQLAQLTSLGCDEAFGFHLSAAVSATEVEALLARRWLPAELLTS